MLEFLRGKASARKLRLFITNYCRRNWHLFHLDERYRNAVEVAERAAEGQVGDQELIPVYKEMWEILTTTRPLDMSPRLIADSCHRAVRPSAGLTVRTVGRAAEYLARVLTASNTSSGDAENQVQIGILHDIFGPLPFRPITLDPSWLPTTVKQLAEAIYQDRAFDRLPILADALEDVGCHQPDILGHLRSGGEHCRGCWAVDLLLDKV
jgi:hypothetical protein